MHTIRDFLGFLILTFSAHSVKLK